LQYQHADALLVTSNSLFTDRRVEIVALAARHALPAAYAWREFVEAGGLISYGPNIAWAYRQIGQPGHPRRCASLAVAHPAAAVAAGRRTVRRRSLAAHRAMDNPPTNRTIKSSSKISAPYFTANLASR
jgi:hypothetical protein